MSKRGQAARPLPHALGWRVPRAQTAAGARAAAGPVQSSAAGALGRGKWRFPVQLPQAAGACYERLQRDPEPSREEVLKQALRIELEPSSPMPRPA